MRKTLMLLTIVSSVVMIGGLSALAQGSLTVSPPTGYVWDNAGQPTINPGCVVSLQITLSNNTGQSIRGYSNGFRVWTTDGGQLTHKLHVDWALNLLRSYPEYLDGGASANLFGDDNDTVGFGGFALFSDGLPDGFYAPAFAIGVFVDPTARYESLCIDSTWFPPSGAWLWSSATSNFYPSWNGPQCWPIDICPCGMWVFTDDGTAFAFNHTELASHTFEAHNELDPDAPTTFRLLEGPGSLTGAGAGAATWTWQPSPADVGNTYTVTVLASGLGEPAQKSIQVYIGSTLGFTRPCGEPVVIAQGDTAIADIGIPPNEFTRFIVDDGGAPPGGCYLDATGLLHFESDLTCRGVYYVQVCLTNLVDSLFCTVPVLVTDETCLLRGNVDGDMTAGGAVNIADMTWLVDYIFAGGVRPTCLEEGNVDGLGEINVSDLTYLTGYLFQGGPIPPPCP